MVRTWLLLLLLGSLERGIDLPDGDPLEGLRATEDEDTRHLMGPEVPHFQELADRGDGALFAFAGEEGESINLLVGVLPQEVVGVGGKEHAPLFLFESAEHDSSFKRTAGCALPYW